MSIKDKIKLWVARLPEKNNQNQFYCLYWAEPDRTGHVYADPSLVKFFKTKISLAKYLIEEEYPFEDGEADNFIFYYENDSHAGWDVFIAEVKE